MAGEGGGWGEKEGGRRKVVGGHREKEGKHTATQDSG